jgi:hypothetical protein
LIRAKENVPLDPAYAQASGGSFEFGIHKASSESLIPSTPRAWITLDIRYARRSSAASGR